MGLVVVREKVCWREERRGEERSGEAGLMWWIDAGGRLAAAERRCLVRMEWLLRAGSPSNDGLANRVMGVYYRLRPEDGEEARGRCLVDP